MCEENTFWQNYLFPSSKKCFSTILGTFWKLEFLTEFNRRGPYKNSENLVLSQIVWRNIFWINCLFPLSKKCFSTILGNFWKIEFLTEFDRRDPYKNSENLLLSQIVLRKYFLDKMFVPFIKEVFLHNLRQFLENWIFDGIWQARTLQK